MGAFQKNVIDVAMDVLDNRESILNVRNMSSLSIVDNLLLYKTDLYTYIKKYFTEQDVMSITITDKYTYKPYLLSLDLYDTHFLGDIILRLNEYKHPIELVSGNIKVISEQGCNKITKYIIDYKTMNR
jgi:hypothetical protein